MVYFLGEQPLSLHIVGANQASTHRVEITCPQLELHVAPSSFPPIQTCQVFRFWRKIFRFFGFLRKPSAIPLCFENLPLFSDFPGDRSATRSENKIGTKNDTKFRSSLGAETLCNLLQVKVNTDYDCHMFRPTKDLLDRARHATGIYNNHRPAARDQSVGMTLNCGNIYSSTDPSTRILDG